MKEPVSIGIYTKADSHSAQSSRSVIEGNSTYKCLAISINIPNPSSYQFLAEFGWLFSRKLRNRSDSCSASVHRRASPWEQHVLHGWRLGGLINRITNLYKVDQTWVTRNKKRFRKCSSIVGLLLEGRETLAFLFAAAEVHRFQGQVLQTRLDSFGSCEMIWQRPNSTTPDILLGWICVWHVSFNQQQSTLNETSQQLFSWHQSNFADSSPFCLLQGFLHWIANQFPWK